LNRFLHNFWKTFLDMLVQLNLIININDQFWEGYCYTGISDRNLSAKGTSSSFEACLWVVFWISLLWIKGNNWCVYWVDQKPLEDEVEMPDFNEGEVVANSTDEENNSADRVLFKVLIECFTSHLSTIYLLENINLVAQMKLASLMLLCVN